MEAIKISYTSDPQSLGRASALFMEKKPLLRLSVIAVNIIAAILLVILILKTILISVALNDIAIIICCSAWLFFRKRFNNWLFCRRVANSPIVNKKIEITISLNGIVWSGEKLLDGKLSWRNISYTLEAQNGFILPYSFNRFLWLPFSGFEKGSNIDELRNLLKEKDIKIKPCYNWKC